MNNDDRYSRQRDIVPCRQACRLPGHGDRRGCHRPTGCLAALQQWAFPGCNWWILT